MRVLRAIVGLVGALMALTPIVQTAVLVACFVFSRMNISEGFMRHRMPRATFDAYIALGIAAPGVALVSLVGLWIVRRRARAGGVSLPPGGRWFVRLCVVNLAALPLWAVMLPTVFFACGGSR